LNEIRVLMAVSPPLLSDALRALLCRKAKIVIVDEVLDPVDILLRARNRRADVVVATLESVPDIPPLVTHLLAEFPDLLIVGIDMQMQRACTYRNRLEVQPIPDFSVAGITKAMVQRAADLDKGKN
jgi:hypothetical protein